MVKNIVKKGEVVLKKDKIIIWLEKEDYIEFKLLENLYGVGFNVFSRTLNKMGIEVKMKGE